VACMTPIAALISAWVTPCVAINTMRSSSSWLRTVRRGGWTSMPPCLLKRQRTVWDVPRRSKYLRSFRPKHAAVGLIGCARDGVNSAGRFDTVKSRQRGPPGSMARRLDDGGWGSLPRMRREAARRSARRAVDRFSSKPKGAARNVQGFRRRHCRHLSADQLRELVALLQTLT
jgi:hypothetical protein